MIIIDKNAGITNIRLPKSTKDEVTIFVLYSELTHAKYTFDVEDIGTSPLFYKFQIDLTDVYDGEYVYSLFNENNASSIDTGYIRIGEEYSDTNEDIYGYSEEYAVYNPETGESEIVYGGGGGGETYYAGKNISIKDYVISVTGITSYTGITSDEITNALGYTPSSIQPEEVVDVVDTKIREAHFATEEYVNNEVSKITPYTGITSQDVINALGYTPTDLTGEEVEAVIDEKISQGDFATKQYVDNILGTINNLLLQI